MEPGTADQDRIDIAAILAGDRERFSALVVRHQGRIISHLRRLVGPADAEDLAQEAFVRSWEALGRYDPTYPFRGWLLVIAGRLAANHHARRRESRMAERPDPVTPDADDPAEIFATAADFAGQRAVLHAAIAALSVGDRELVELRYRQGLSGREIAAHLQCSEPALRVRLVRMRQRLADLLGQDPFEENRDG